MVVGSNLTLSNVMLDLKISFMYLKTQKGIFICTKLMPKAKKFKKQKINGEPLRTTVLLLNTNKVWPAERPLAPPDPFTSET